jgi:hypothetical protein
MTSPTTNIRWSAKRAISAVARVDERLGSMSTSEV